jgi:hypothetical protein
MFADLRVDPLRMSEQLKGVLAHDCHESALGRLSGA